MLLLYFRDIPRDFPHRPVSPEQLPARHTSRAVDSGMPGRPSKTKGYSPSAALKSDAQDYLYDHSKIEQQSCGGFSLLNYHQAPRCGEMAFGWSNHFLPRVS